MTSFAPARPVVRPDCDPAPSALPDIDRSELFERVSVSSRADGRPLSYFPDFAALGALMDYDPDRNPRRL